MAVKHRNARSQSIINAASSLFIEEGYQVNMAEVARRAGVAKQTVYTHFKTKENLFEAAIVNLIEPLRQLLEPDHRSIRESLEAYGMSHVGGWLDASTADLSRRLIAEAARFPDAAQTLYLNTSEAIQQQLAMRLEAAATRGEVRIEDSSVAAELLVGMLFGMDADRRRMGMPLRDAARREAWVKHAVDVFLRAHAPG
jgi:AcrR family transcriptional regulator